MARDTDVQHRGDDREKNHGAASPPISRTALFTFPDSASLRAALNGESEDFVYSRVSNPTVRALEEKVATLEGGDDAVASSSGMSAISSVLLALLQTGDHLVVCARSYGPTLVFVRDLLEPLGIEVTRVEPSDAADLSGVLRDTTKLVYLESPASLTFEVSDLRAAAKLARSRGIPTVADNSWATPIFQRPIQLGIDLVLHSGTKYIGGHSAVLMGLVVGSQELIDRVRHTSVLLGASLSPEDAFLALRGLRTLPLRMERHQANALELSHRLLAHDRVVEVLHPAHPFFATHGLWLDQFDGASGLFAFRVDGDPCRFCDVLEIFLLGVSWGGTESLALPSPVLPEKQKLGNGSSVRPDLPDDLVRLSVGLEDPEDLWKDLSRGFAAL